MRMVVYDAIGAISDMMSFRRRKNQRKSKRKKCGLKIQGLHFINRCDNSNILAMLLIVLRHVFWGKLIRNFVRTKQQKITK